MVDVRITHGPAPTREERMKLILDYDLRIERLEAELAQAVRERQPSQSLTVKREFIKTQREHLDYIWFYAKVEGITERQYSEWKARLTSAGR